MFWQEFFRLIEEAPKVGTGGAAVKLSEKEMSGGSIPKVRFLLRLGVFAPCAISLE